MRNEIDVWYVVTTDPILIPTSRTNNIYRFNHVKMFVLINGQDVAQHVYSRVVDYQHWTGTSFDSYQSLFYVKNEPLRKLNATQSMEAMNLLAKLTKELRDPAIPQNKQRVSIKEAKLRNEICLLDLKITCGFKNPQYRSHSLNYVMPLSGHERTRIGPDGEPVFVETQGIFQSLIDWTVMKLREPHIIELMQPFEPRYSKELKREVKDYAPYRKLRMFEHEKLERHILEKLFRHYKDLSNAYYRLLDSFNELNDQYMKLINATRSGKRRRQQQQPLLVPVAVPVAGGMNPRFAGIGPAQYPKPK